MSEDVKNIGDILRLANEQQVAELETEVPFRHSIDNEGTLKIKAKWRRQ